MNSSFKVYPLAPRKSSLLFLWLKNLSTTAKLITFNVFMFILFNILLLLKIPESYIALQPASIMQGKYLWTLLTSIFMHAGIFHLFVNMFSLFFLGSFLERLIGRKRYFWLYILSGIFAGIFYSALSYYFGSSAFGAGIFGSPDSFAVGASGAIFAVAGLLAVITPRKRVLMIAGPLLAIILAAIIGVLGIPDFIKSAVSFLANIYLFISIFALFSPSPSIRKISIPIEMPFWILPYVAIIPLIIIGFFVELPIGNMAHLGGLLCGMAYGTYLRTKYKRKTEAISRHFSG